jgi:hypothetical protein
MPSEVLLTIWMINFSLDPRTSITIICVCAQAGLETESATEIQEKRNLTSLKHPCSASRFCGCC